MKIAMLDKLQPVKKGDILAAYTPKNRNNLGTHIFLKRVMKKCSYKQTFYVDKSHRHPWICFDRCTWGIYPTNDRNVYYIWGYT